MGMKAQEERAFLIFEAGGGTYALEAEAVRGVLGHRQYEPLTTHLSCGIAGTIWVWERRVPVIDLRRVPLPPTADPLCIYVLTEVQGQLLALLVDELLDVVRVPVSPAGGRIRLPHGSAAVVTVEGLIAERVAEFGRANSVLPELGETAAAISTRR
jgi:chemotaxis signal transduction protein